LQYFEISLDQVLCPPDLAGEEQIAEQHPWVFGLLFSLQTMSQSFPHSICNQPNSICLVQEHQLQHIVIYTRIDNFQTTKLSMGLFELMEIAYDML